MRSARYSARIGEVCCICSDIPYETLLVRLMEFTVRAAVAKSADQSVWEHEQLRTHGIEALQIFRRAPQPRGQHELNPQFFARLDRDLRARWRRFGYHTASLRDNMKALFSELEYDATQAAADARGRLLADFIAALQETS